MKKNNKITNLAITILALAISPIFGIGMMGTNVLEYRNATEGHSYFEDRADFIIHHDNIEAGGRILLQQPSRLNSENRDTVYKGIDHRYLRYKTDNFSVTAGTFYETFGRGLTLDLLEDRRLVVDHRLDGAKFSFDVPYVSGKAVHGLSDWDRGTKLQGFELVAKPPYSEIGASYIDYFDELRPRINAYSVFAGVNFGIGNLYGEFSEKHIVGTGEDGRALYGSADIFLAGYSFLIEYKNYLDYNMRGNLKYYNNPPTCMREPSYTLQSRSVHQQDPGNEQGLQLTHFGSYPLDIDLEFSAAMIMKAEIEDGEFGDYLDESYMEIYADFYREWDMLGQHLILQYQKDKLTHDEQRITAIANGYFLFDYIHNIQWDIEFQLEMPDEGDSQNHFMLGLEGILIEDLSLGTELVMLGQEDAYDVSPWAFISCDLLEGHSIMLGYGRRAGGYTCAGGFCRYEQPFEGFELSIISSF
ncbi:MAG: DUF6029 family protein [Candidatus Zixiibacteriota bacterium]